MVVAQLESQRSEADEENPEPDDDTEAAPNMTGRVVVLLSNVSGAIDDAIAVAAEDGASAMGRGGGWVARAIRDVVWLDTCQLPAHELICHQGFEGVGAGVQIKDPAEPDMHLPEWNQVASVNEENRREQPRDFGCVAKALADRAHCPEQLDEAQGLDNDDNPKRKESSRVHLQS